MVMNHLYRCFVIFWLWMFTVSDNMFHDFWHHVHDGHIVLLPVHVVMISVHIALFPGCTFWLCQVRRFMFFCRLILCFCIFWDHSICFMESGHMFYFLAKSFNDFWPNVPQYLPIFVHDVWPYASRFFTICFMMSGHAIHYNFYDFWPYVARMKT